METTDLGTLEWLDPRSVWKNEAYDFTPWLRANIHVLGAALGLEIDSDVQQEVAVGLFSADLLGTDVASRAGILIENQLEPTNHSHLGQLLTYAAGLGTDILVWVATKVREEHRQALTWLNERTHDGVYFFGVEVELLRIGESKPAPHLRVVVAPNEWQKQASRPGGSSATGTRTAKQEQYRAYWATLLEDIRKRDKSFTTRTPERAPHQSWISFSPGRSGFQNNAVFGWEESISKAVLRVELYIDTGHQSQNKAAFDMLLAERSAIEAAFGEELFWTRRDDIRASRIYARREGSVDDGADALQAYREWFIDCLFRARDVFGPRVRALDLPPATELQGSADADKDLVDPHAEADHTTA